MPAGQTGAKTGLKASSLPESAAKDLYPLASLLYGLTAIKKAVPEIKEAKAV